MVGPHQEFLEPPAGPGDEPRVAADSSTVADHCQAMFQEWHVKYGTKALRVIVSRSAQWGVVWRADVVDRKYPGLTSRWICYKQPHADGVALEMRPLQMFDPSQSIGPLDDKPPLPTH